MKICFVGSADGIISVPFVLSALIMFMSVFILLFVLRDIIDSLLDSTVLEIRYASVSGCDKYSHLYFMQRSDKRNVGQRRARFIRRFEFAL